MFFVKTLIFVNIFPYITIQHKIDEIVYIEASALEIIPINSPVIITKSQSIPESNCTKILFLFICFGLFYYFYM